MNSQDPGPKPEPEAQRGDPSPGGADASHTSGADGTVGVDGVERGDAVPADLDPDLNPAVEDALPDEVREGEDTETKATDDDSGDVESGEEEPA